MPLTLRSNPVTQVTEVLHPDLGTYFQAAILMPTTDGVIVRLAPDQSVAINQTANNTQPLPSILDGIESVKGDTGSINELVEAHLPLISSHTSDALTLLIQVDNRLMDILNQLSVTKETVPEIRTLTLSNANTEYYFDFPVKTTRYAFKCRGGDSDTVARLRWSWEQGTVAGASGSGPAIGNYDVLQSNIEESEAVWWPNGQRLYIASSQANVAVAIRYWTQGN